MDKKTVLYDEHVRMGAKMVPFGGFIMPVQYTDIIKEHMAVRTAAGLFDVSHMGEIMLEGPDALKNLNLLLTNDYTGMKDGKVRYSPMCNENGGVVDDLLVYRMGGEKYLIVVNASNCEKDFAWMQAHAVGDAVFTNISESIAEIAIQGPASGKILEKLTDPSNLPEKYYTFLEHCDVAGVDCLISQTGYTGEYGFELYFAAEEAAKLWNLLLEAGQEYGLLPCGLGARDTLRMEAAMPLYGHEMDDTVTPLETGLGFAVKMGKEDFIGKAAMEAKGEPAVTRVGLKVTGKGLVREHTELTCGGEAAGHTTSGTHLPFLKGAYAMALVPKKYSRIGTELTAHVRNREVSCEVIPLPFYSRKK